MYVYKVTNLINGKAYIGITNDFKRRMDNHKCGKKQAVDLAIQKYGEENFLYEVLYENVSEEDAINKEKELIKLYNTKTPDGYNVSFGGDYISGVQKELATRNGVENGRAMLTEEEVSFIKNNRNLPMMYLFEIYIQEYGDNITYQTFKKVYNDQTYKNIKPTVDPYPFNAEFSNLMKASSLSIAEIMDLREQYKQIVFWKDAYEPYKDRMRWDSFWQIYNGYGAKGRIIMPDVFTEENKRKHHLLKGERSMSGEKNPRAKLTTEDVLRIRKLYDSGTAFKELYALYPQVTPTNIRDICHRKTWKNI